MKRDQFSTPMARVSHGEELCSIRLFEQEMAIVNEIGTGASTVSDLAKRFAITPRRVRQIFAGSVRANWSIEGNKSKDVEIALKQFPELSSRKIAALCTVSEMYVKGIKRRRSEDIASLPLVGLVYEILDSRKSGFNHKYMDEHFAMLRQRIHNHRTDDYRSIIDTMINEFIDKNPGDKCDDLLAEINIMFSDHGG